MEQLKTSKFLKMNNKMSEQLKNNIIKLNNIYMAVNKCADSFKNGSKALSNYTNQIKAASHAIDSFQVVSKQMDSKDGKKSINKVYTPKIQKLDKSFEKLNATTSNTNLGVIGDLLNIFPRITEPIVSMSQSFISWGQSNTIVITLIKSFKALIGTLIFLKALGFNVTKPLLKMLGKLWKIASGSFSKIGKIASDNLGKIGKIAKTLGKGFTGIFGKLGKIGSENFGKLGKIGSENFGKLGKIGSENFGKLGKIGSENFGKLGKIAKTLGKVFTGMFGNPLKGVLGLGKGVLKIFSKIGKGASGIFGGILKGALGLKKGGLPIQSFGKKLFSLQSKGPLVSKSIMGGVKGFINTITGKVEVKDDSTKKVKEMSKKNNNSTNKHTTIHNNNTFHVHETSNSKKTAEKTANHIQKLSLSGSGK